MRFCGAPLISIAPPTWCLDGHQQIKIRSVWNDVMWDLGGWLFWLPKIPPPRTNISHPKGLLKMIFLRLSWDMLVPTMVSARRKNCTIKVLLFASIVFGTKTLCQQISIVFFGSHPKITKHHLWPMYHPQLHQRSMGNTFQGKSLTHLTHHPVLTLANYASNSLSPSGPMRMVTKDIVPFGIQFGRAGEWHGKISLGDLWWTLCFFEDARPPRWATTGLNPGYL